MNDNDKIYRNTLNEDLLELEDINVGFIEEDEQFDENQKIDNDFDEIEQLRNLLSSTEKDDFVETETHDIHKEDLMKNKKEFKIREEFIKESLKPSKDYESLPEQTVIENEHLETPRSKKENIKLNFMLVSSFVLIFVLISFLLTPQLLPSGRDLNKSKILYTNTNSVEIDGTFVSYNKNEDTITVLIENNNARINYDVRGSYLLLNEKAYLPDINQLSSLPTIAFGETTKENENIKGTLFFDKNTLNNVEYFVISDILIDSHSYDIFFEL